MSRSFIKMHGLGNDFVILDGRADDFAPSQEFCVAIADRRRGIGCDQLIVLNKPRAPGATLFMRIYNQDGSEAKACGNATRCVAKLLFEELGCTDVVIETVAGLLPVHLESTDRIAVDFGKPNLDWQSIPLAHQMDTLHVPLTVGHLTEACCVNVGNPHAVFFVPDVHQVPLEQWGPGLETHALFPDRCNIEFAQIMGPDRIRMRVWERGSGVTQACGSGATATLVAAVRRGLSARRATIVLDGGELIVEWRADDHVILIGSATMVFKGIWE